MQHSDRKASENFSMNSGIPKDPFVQSRTRREIIDAMIKKNLMDGLQVGDKVTCNHGSGILKSYNGDSGQCSVEIDVDGQWPQTNIFVRQSRQQSPR